MGRSMPPLNLKAALPIVLAMVSVMSLGCQQSRMVTGGVRAIWVTRGDYRSPDDVTRIMEDCSRGGFNVVVFQVRGNGTTFYPSRIEPWAEQFEFQNPGFDPLALAIQEAHRRKLELHAWVNVMPAWRGTKAPTCPEQLYNKHPNWFWYDQQGRRQPLTSFYVSLNPCLPEVRQYLVDVFREIVANYAIDGLHMDYIRFPSEPPAIPSGSGIDYPRDAKTLALYKKATGLEPDANPESWKKWRTDQVTQLVADIRTMMRRERPSAALSASVGAEYNESLRFFRDDRRWVREQLLDAAFLMNYKSDLAAFDSALTGWLPLRSEVTVVPGLWFAPRLDTAKGIEVVKQQIQSSHQKTGNFCVFSYGALFEIRENRDRFGEEDRPAARQTEATTRRTARRKALLPVTRLVAPSVLATGG
ncbi:MAG: family 10 glycosylhydrolase [Phycisphaerae bacterium]|nr:family 10 glycosylhydrolase [Phycisphaerae bacterium]